jgi:hypothetical protein
MERQQQFSGWSLLNEVVQDKVYLSKGIILILF